MYASYLKKLALFLFIPCSFLALNIFFLFRAGEYASLQTIAEQQRTGPSFCIYGSALHGDSFFYKLEGERAHEADIISLGSSRVLQFRGSFFRSPFYNMGLAVDSINGGRQLTTLMKTIRTPKVILLGIEFWWFNEAFASTTYVKRLPTPGPRMHFSDVIEPIRFLRQGKITISQFIRILFSSDNSHCFLGLQAIQTHSGFGPDGSYYYTDLIAGKRTDAEVGFEATRKAIDRGTGRFVYGTSIPDRHWEEFVAWIRDMQAQGISVVPFIPPIAPSVYVEMEKHRDRYAYINELLQKTKDAGIPLLDLRDARLVGSPDCEFVDGIHGGDVTYARLLLTLAKKNPSLLPFIDEEQLRTFILHNNGKTMEQDPRLTNDPEVDFLKLGCKK